jgi:hypothetical protein
MRLSTWRGLVLAFLAGSTTACPLNLDYLDSAQPPGTDAGNADAVERDSLASDGGELDSSEVPKADASEMADAADAEGASQVDATLDAAPMNIIRNPGFELGVTPWTTFSDGTSVATLDASSTFVHSGMYSGHVSNRTKPFQGAVQEIHNLVIPGHTYQAVAWVLVGNPADAGPDAAAILPQPTQFTAAVTCLVDGAQTTTYIPVGISSADSSTWMSVSGALTVPICDLSMLEIYVEGPAPGLDMYVDDLSLTP